MELRNNLNEYMQPGERNLMAYAWLFVYLGWLVELHLRNTVYVSFSHKFWSDVYSDRLFATFNFEV